MPGAQRRPITCEAAKGLPSARPRSQARIGIRHRRDDATHTIASDPMIERNPMFFALPMFCCDRIGETEAAVDTHAASEDTAYSKKRCGCS